MENMANMGQGMGQKALRLGWLVNGKEKAETKLPRGNQMATRYIQTCKRTGWPGRERDQSEHVAHGLDWAGFEQGGIGSGATIDRTLCVKNYYF